MKRATAPLLLTLLAVAGCGRQGDPLPPPSRVPAHVADLKVEQRGDEVRLEFQYPAVTVGGLPLQGIRAVEVWEAIQPWVPGAPAATAEDEPGVTLEEVPGEPPEAAAEEVPEELPEGTTEEGALPAVEPGEEASPGAALLPRISAPELQAAAQAIATITGEALEQAIVGGRVVLSLSRHQLGSLPAGEREEAADEAEGAEEVLEAHFLAVKTTSPEGKTSALSNPAPLLPAAPPPPPSGLAATPREEGVELAWRLPPDIELEGVVVYRRGEQETGFGTPLTTLPADAELHVDDDVEFDRTYVYAVAGLGRREPRVQSVLSSEVSARVEDVFAPAPPLRVAAFPAPDRVRLIWEASTSGDVAGYRVERRTADGAFEVLTPQPLTAPEYIDTRVLTGATYVYRVLVLDRAGNVSEPSAEEVVRVP
ncbi:MAG: fibronectin type III domain-containing protein [Thermoanaerobaculia bacterium]